MSQHGLMSWKEECDAIHREMDRLLAAGWLETAEERQVRKIQFMALIERRNVAAQHFLKADGNNAEFNQQKPSETPLVMTNADPRLKVAATDVKTCQEASEAANVVDRGSQVPPDDLMFEFDIMNDKVSQEPPEAAPTIDKSPQAPLADPRFEARNFLKFLGLR